VSNKVRAVGDRPDGQPRWLALDGSVLFAAGHAASERYLTRVEDSLTTRLGVQFAARADTVSAGQRVVREVVGVPEALIWHFSKRRADIKQMHAALLRDYRIQYGRRASTAMEAKLAQMATLATRPDKVAPRTLQALIEDWTSQAGAVAGQEGIRAIRGAVGRAPTVPDGADIPVDQLARAVVATLERQRATWTRWNLVAEVERQTRALRPASPDDRDAIVVAVTERALSPAFTVRVAPVAVQPLPGDRAHFAGPTPVDTARYTTSRILDAEVALVAAAREPMRHAMLPACATSALEVYGTRSGSRLDPDQQALAVAFTSVDRRLVAGIASAGAGRTAAMRAACHAWDSSGTHVVPLATSDASATVLASELGRQAESLGWFLDQLERPRPANPDFSRLGAGDVVLVDEAGMAGTLRLAELLVHARAAGASIRLLGDPTQLAAAESGAVLRLITSEMGGLPLSTLHRLESPEEEQATLRLRAGDPTCLDFYADNQRLRSGSRQAMLDAACDGWAQDVRAGLSSVIICGSSQDAPTLARRARAHRVLLGLVDEHGVALADGNNASRGDWIVTEVSRRTITTCGGRDFVKTGDPWTIVQRHPGDSLTVQHQRHRGQLTLPGDYVREHVRLAYALTAQTCRGVSVDTAHPVVGPQTTREALYLGATRGRRATTVYVGVGQAADDHTAGQSSPRDAARRLLATLIARPEASADIATRRLSHADDARDPARIAGPGAPGRRPVVMEPPSSA
jgi:AAA domain/TrwC relaxase